MGPREQDNDMVLLVAVTLICTALVGVLELAQSKPATAARPTVLASDVPAVRVILPFTPNTTPSAR